MSLGVWVTNLAASPPPLVFLTRTQTHAHYQYYTGQTLLATVCMPEPQVWPLNLMKLHRIRMEQTPVYRTLADEVLLKFLEELQVE